MQKQPVLSKKIQNGGFIRATFFCQIGPLSRDRARILYLIILWVDASWPSKPVGSFLVCNRITIAQGLK